ncbi:hypothetical protein LTS12_013250 [Elasticomyces elasticus]|nr:hypothetical protein LTS12_013250 [Elasticomyces elasticus]
MATLAHRPDTNSTGTTTLSTRSTLPSSSHTHSQQTSYPSPLPLPTHTPRTPHNHKYTHRQPSKPIRPQYPPSTTEKHVEYILLASFDIDHGSIMEAQYPGPVGGDEHMLAELMLPDQTHLRAQDWTIFFLHKDGAEEEENQVEGEEGAEAVGKENKKKRKRRRNKVVDEVEGEGGEEAEAGAEEGSEDVDGEDEDGESSDDSSSSSSSSTSTSSSDPPLVYVLNLVNTKTDPSHKRGAVVKAMAICTRHSFLHIYKPLLLLALEKYFEKPSMGVLEELYEAVNAMDLSLIPRLNTWERRVLQSSDAKDLFLEKFEGLVAQRMAEDGNEQQQLQRPNYGLPRDTHEATTHVSYSGTSIPMPIPTSPLPETVGDFSLLKLLTTFSVPHATSPIPFSNPHPHLTTSGPLTHPIIVLLNALLTQKRIIFLGHNLPSSLVGESVLAACSLASGGLLRGFTRHSFPYTDLSKIEELLRVPGFVAGVTNPVVGMKEGWWDLLCDLSTGRMRISGQIEQWGVGTVPEGVRFFQNPGAHHLTPTSALGGGAGGISAIAIAGASLSAGLGGSGSLGIMGGGDATGDQAFMAGVLKAVEERQGEGAVRRKFRRWVLRFTRLAAGFEEVVYGASLLVVAPTGGVGEGGAGHGYVWASAQGKVNELAANAARIEGWRLTRSYYNFVRDMAEAYPRRRVKSWRN